MRGIDCSHWQGVIDWKNVRASGVEFAYIKATENTRQNLKAALETARAALAEATRLIAEL